MDSLKVIIRKASGSPVVDSEVQAALTLLRSKIAVDPNAVLHTYGLRAGAFEAIADVSTGLTQGQFQGFVDDLLPAGVIGWVSLNDDRGNPLFEATINVTVDGKTYTPVPRETTWSIARA